MSRTQPVRRVHPVLLALLLVQSLMHLFWLSISAHSGQTTVPWLMNRGRLLFGEVLEQHAPGSSLLAAAAQRVLPLAPGDLAVVLNLVLVLLLTAMVYWLARWFAGETAGLLAALVWAWWEPVWGNVLFYFDTLLAAFVLGGVIAWLRAARPGPGPALLAGLLFGGATVMKQHAWLAVLLFAGWLLVTGRRPRVLIAYAAGVLVAPGLVILVTALQGTLDAYLYWNWAFNLSGLMPGVMPDGDFLRKLLLVEVFLPAFLLLTWRREIARAPGVLLLLLTLAGAVTLVPRSGEIHVMGHLPFVCVMSGVVLARVLPALRASGSAAAPVLAGVLLALAAGWLWTGAVSYVPHPIGLAAEPGYDEFRPLVDAVREQADAHPDDPPTLFVLPQTDSTPQLHPLTGLLPPGTWVKGWAWYLAPPTGMVDTLLAEWSQQPPSLVVVFPELIAAGQPGIDALLAFVDDGYDLVGREPAVYDHGEALIYRRR